MLTGAMHRVVVQEIARSVGADAVSNEPAFRIFMTGLPGRKHRHWQTNSPKREIVGELLWQHERVIGGRDQDCDIAPGMTETKTHARKTKCRRVDDHGCNLDGLQRIYPGVRS